jgi:hypothetical protein
VSIALRGQLGRGDKKRIEASYEMIEKAVKRGEVSKFALGILDNRYPIDALGNSRASR